MQRGTILFGVGCLVCLVAVAPGTGGAGTTAANATIADDALPLEAGPGQAIHGETDLPAGTSVTVRVTIFPAETPFEHERTATVTRDGEFHAVVDLSVVPPDTPAEVAVEAGDGVLATETTTVEPCGTACDQGGPASPDADITLDEDERLTLEAGPGRAVRGETSFPPGTALAVVLQSTSADGSPWHVRETATVTAGGRFHAVFDLSEFDEPDGVDASLELVAPNRSAPPVERSVTITECTTACGPPETGAEVSQFAGRVTEDTVTDVTYGETVLLPIDLHGADAVRVRIGGADGGFDATVRVADGTGNGRVTVAFNTQPAGGGPVMFAAEPGDTVTVETISGVLSPDDVLEVAIDADGSASDHADRVRLRVTEPAGGGAEPPTVGGDGREPGTPSSSPVPWVEIALLAAATVCATAGIALLAGLFDRS